MAVDVEKARERLLELKREIEAQSELGSEDRATVALDQQSVGRLSRMDAMQRQAMAQAQERARTSQLQRIDVALRRIGSGDYGTCDECGEEIAPRRLEIDPATTVCVRCAA